MNTQTAKHALKLTARSMAAAAALLTLAHCGGSGGSGGDDAKASGSYEDACAQLPACQQPDPRALEPKVQIWRVEVVREKDGSVSFGARDQVGVPGQSGVATSALGGTHLLVSYDASNTVLNATAIAFPQTVLAESFGEPISQGEELPLSGQVRVIGHVRAAGVTRLAVVDAKGEEVVSTAVEAKAAAPAGQNLLRQSLVTRIEGCPHVVVLEEGEDYQWIPDAIQGQLVRPGNMQLAVLTAALKKMPPLMCQAVKRVAFMTNSNRVGGATRGAVDGGYAADMIILNADAYSEEALSTDPKLQLALMQTILHEGMHATDFLLSSRGTGTTPTTPIEELLGAFYETFNKKFEVMGGWDFKALSEAWDAIDQLRLRKGFRLEWVRIQQAFRAKGWAGQYRPLSRPASKEQIAALKGLGEDDVAQQAAMTRYGVTGPADDIAEMVAATKMHREYEAKGLRASDSSDAVGCRALRALPGPVLPADYAALFTKLRMMRQLELLTKEEYDDCVGPNIKVEVVQQGMNFDNSTQFATAVSARIGTDPNHGDRWTFVFESKGELTFGDTVSPATGTIQLEVAAAGEPVEHASWPRGYYNLIPLKGNDFRVTLKDAPSGSFEVFDGDLLVFDASNDLIQGSIVVRRAMRWLAPVPVPQTFDPPLSVRFRIAKRGQ